MNHVNAAFVFLASIGLCACQAVEAPASAPIVGSNSDLSSFEGAKAGQAEMGIQTLGFELIRSEGLTSYWVNRSNGACAEITTAQGRYSDVTMLPSGDC
ncbi:MAG: hypothetical protein ABJO67_06120 [Pseudoruegeria sp.]